ncbi:uncharacterized protein BO95DRAFT_466812 [Aspergillus brunneoviolaceus CBS 621.78]|uniref:Uncharacterized protein n=1 Tax=Aspergillus brunneoviolaceus CBS 621.78 TaxID=1450534 RepID=A0ACD1FZY3_9EURO|nr:hypothetical protein BO95DRAFT_466812 [Aspergillus brunneoviolaceus CBS 621.78]RAH42534.1 hypothetical protein BO95DRAFT_466812 [Aspergillus brunneoviolaceus CBS 621.78]
MIFKKRNIKDHELHPRRIGQLRERIQQLTRHSTIQGHVDEGLVSPFVKAQNTVNSEFHVYIADERTILDQTLLLGGFEGHEIQATVRVAPEYLDIQAVNLVTWNMDVV